MSRYAKDTEGKDRTRSYASAPKPLAIAIRRGTVSLSPSPLSPSPPPSPPGARPRSGRAARSLSPHRSPHRLFAALRLCVSRESHGDIEAVARRNPGDGAVQGSDEITGCPSNPWTTPPLLPATADDRDARLMPGTPSRHFACSNTYFSRYDPSPPPVSLSPLPTLSFRVIGHLHEASEGPMDPTAAFNSVVRLFRTDEKVLRVSRVHQRIASLCNAPQRVPFVPFP